MDIPNPATVPLFVKPDSKKIVKRDLLLTIFFARLKAGDIQNLNMPLPGQCLLLLQESCCSDAFLDVTKTLLEHNINPNQYIISTEPPLYLACRHLATQTADLLLNAQAILTRAAHCHNGPLHIICDPLQDTIIQKKVDRRIAIAKALISHGANPKETTSTGQNCFEYLATNPFKSFEIPALTKDEKKLIFTQRSKLLEIIKKVNDKTF